MKQKVLFVAHMLRGHVLVFHLPYMKWFQEQGYEVHLCSCNDTEKPVTEVPYCDRFFDLPFQRSPFGRQNLQVYREIKKLVDREDYALIHCHTPVGGMVGRLAARGEVKGFIPGEEFSIFQEETRRALLLCGELRRDRDLDRHNNGVTFVILSGGR